MPGGPVRPGEWLTWRLTYVAGERGLAAGSAIEVSWHRSLHPACYILEGDWTPPQDSDPAAPGYTTAHATGQARVALEFPPPWEFAGSRYPNPPPTASLAPRQAIRVRLVEGRLAPAERIEIVYGNPSRGSPGARAQSIRQDAVPFQAWVDDAGTGAWRALSLSPSVRVIGGEAASLRLIAPSLVCRREPFDLAVVALDAHGNPADGFASPLKLTGQVDGLPESVPSGDWHEGVLIVPRLRWAHAGTYRIAAQAGRLRATSNPIVVRASPPGERIYWGDLHLHSWLSDGLRSPHECYRYARDVSRLDLAALTDHDPPIADHWDELRRATTWYHHPGRFVTLLGYEWSHGRWGHKGVYFPGDEGAPVTLRRPPTPARLYRALEELGALVISQHPAGGPAPTVWKAVDARREPLVEIYSCHGNCESPDGARPLWCLSPARPPSYVRDALARGLKLGFVAGSNSHLGDPGSPILQHALHPHPWRLGLTAVLAPELTRQAIWQALWQRRCYATTGERIYLDLEVAGHGMGQTVEAAGPVSIQAAVHGTARLVAVDLVRDGRLLRRESSSTSDGAWAWSDDPGPGEHCYYLRVTQWDQEMAWSSPIWLMAT